MLRTFVVIAVSALSVASHAIAQGLRVGELKDAKTLTSSPVCPEIGRGQAQTVRLVRQTIVTYAGPGTRVLINDGILKSSEVLARMDVAADVGGRGTFYFVPTIGCYPGLKGDRWAGEIPHAVSSVYQFGTRTAPVNGNLTRALALVLDRGSVIIHWERGTPLVVVLPVDSVVVIGTTVAIAVDSTRRRVLLYVEKGTVFVPSLQRNLTDGQIVQWPGGVVTTRNAADDALQQTTRYYTKDAWGRRGWLKWAVGGVVGGSLGYCAVTKCWAPDLTGTVIVQIPGILR